MRQLGIATLGTLRDHPRITRFRDFLKGWYLSYFTPDAARGLPVAGPQRHLNVHGDNLGNVVQFMQREHKDRFESILRRIAERIPGIKDRYPRYRGQAGPAALQRRGLYRPVFRPADVRRHAEGVCLSCCCWRTQIRRPSSVSRSPRTACTTNFSKHWHGNSEPMPRDGEMRRRYSLPRISPISSMRSTPKRYGYWRRDRRIFRYPPCVRA
jgi:hypothetical protein